jgi:subtilisin family serine protease
MHDRELQVRRMKIQDNAIWNLDMLTSPYSDRWYKYKYTGKGVTVYVLDSGIDHSNRQFGGRASCGWDAYKSNCKDIKKHGSHVAGTIGSQRYGVAKNVKLVGVKVLGDDGSGTYDNVIAGIDWVIGKKLSKPDSPMVINMSLGGPYNELLNVAVQAATDAGITVVVAAGNDYGSDACNHQLLNQVQ